MNFITTSSRNFIYDLFGIDSHDISDENDRDCKYGSQYTLSVLGGKVLVFGQEYYDQGENCCDLSFKDMKTGERVRCTGATSSARYVAGGGGRYVEGEQGVHWEEEKVKQCQAFLSARSLG